MKFLRTLIENIKRDDSKTNEDGEPEVHIDRRGRLYVDINELFESPSFRRQIEIAASIDIAGNTKNS